MHELLKVTGANTFECGRQIGQVNFEILHEFIESTRTNPPNGLSWQDCIDIGRDNYLPWAESLFPQVVDALKGASVGAQAKGANFSFEELFAFTIEELDQSPWQIPQKISSAPEHCTDIIFGPPLTLGNEMLVGHNNDLGASMLSKISAVEWSLPWGKMLTIGPGGIYLSVGMNSHKIALAGNEVWPLDGRKFGVPRAVVASAILFARDMPEAVSIALCPWRASSYVNTISSSDEVVSVEASAQKHKLLGLENGWFVHANSYIDDEMILLDAFPNWPTSISRQIRGEALARVQRMLVNSNDVKKILRDHGVGGLSNAGTICRHDFGNSEIPMTVFSTFMNVTRGTVEITWGPPCQSDFQLIWETN